MPLINLFVISPDTHSERRLDSSLTVEQLKYKLSPITGINPATQRLSIYRNVESAEAKGQPLQWLQDEQASLEAYGIVEWNCIRVENTDPNAKPEGEFTDLSAVNKFELTNEEYEARQDTVLSHLKAQKLGRFAPVPTPLAHAPPPAPTPESIQPGARCELAANQPGGVSKRGTVRFVGETSFGKGGGDWVGVELDEPVGKGDGSVDGTRYFTCPMLHASFVRPDKVTIGDFPEEDLMADDDDVDEL